MKSSVINECDGRPATQTSSLPHRADGASLTVAVAGDPANDPVLSKSAPRGCDRHPWRSDHPPEVADPIRCPRNRSRRHLRSDVQDQLREQSSDHGHDPVHAASQNRRPGGEMVRLLAGIRTGPAQPVRLLRHHWTRKLRRRVWSVQTALRVAHLVVDYLPTMRGQRAVLVPTRWNDGVVAAVAGDWSAVPLARVGPFGRLRPRTVPRAAGPPARDIWLRLCNEILGENLLVPEFVTVAWRCAGSP
jgi:hypothetical protein